MITSRNTFNFSAFFYAVDFSSPFMKNVSSRPNDPSYRIQYPAVWFKRKNGFAAVVKGFLWSYVRNIDVTDVAAVEAEFKASFDGRYGGNAEFRWDGVNMWAPEQDFTTTAATQQELDQYLNAFPAIPAGYTGWYSIK